MLFRRFGGDKNPERELTLIGHLDELRLRLFICAGFFVIAVIASYAFSAPVLKMLIKPVDTIRAEKPRPAGDPTTLSLVISPEGVLQIAPEQDPKAMKSLDSVTLILPAAGDGGTTRTLSLQGNSKQSKIVYSSPLDPIMMQFKVAIVMGILFSLIVWVWQIWLFIAPGLTDKEKLVIRPLLLWAIFLFPAGALFAYAMLFFIIQMMQRYIVPGIDILYNVQSYLKLTTTLMIIFGLIFELPLVIALLARIGVVTPAFLRQYWRHAYVALTFLAIVITPTTDPFTLLLALGPLIALYEISIWIAKPMAMLRARAQADADSEEANPA